MKKIILIIFLLCTLLFAEDTFNFIKGNSLYSCFFAKNDYLALGSESKINLFQNNALDFKLKKIIDLNSQKPIKLYIEDAFLFALLDWNQISIWDLNTGYSIQNFKFQEKLSDLLFLDSTLIVSTMNGVLYSFKYSGNKFLKNESIVAHGNSISKLLKSKSNKEFLSCSYDGKIIFWMQYNNKLQNFFELKSNKGKAIFSAALSKNNQFLAFSCQDKIVEIYKETANKSYQIVSRFTCPDNVYSLTFSEDEKFLSLAMPNENILVLEDINNFFYKKVKIKKTFSKKNYIDICFWNNFLLSISSLGQMDFLSIFPIKEQIEFNVNKETVHLKYQVSKEKLNKIALKYLDIFKKEKTKNIAWDSLKIDSQYINKGYLIETPLKENIFLQVNENFKDSFYHNFPNKKVQNIELAYFDNAWKIKNLDIQIKENLYSYQNIALKDSLKNFVFANSFLPEQTFYNLKDNIYQTKIIKYNAKAFLIANENYQNFPVNKYSLNNVDIFYEYLTKSLGYLPQNIKIAKDCDNFKKMFEDFISSLKNEPEVLIYYSGYSALDFMNKKPYLLPINSQIDDFSESGISFYKLIGDLGNKNNIKVYLILETSLYGADVYQNIKINNYAFDIDLPDNTNVIFAGKFFQKRIKDANLNLDLFTYSFLKAINNSVYTRNNKLKNVFDYSLLDMKNYSENNLETFQEPILWTNNMDILFIQ